MTELDLAHIDRSGSLGDQLEAIIAALPEDHLTLGQLLQVFGDEVGRHARSAVGVASLPWSIPVEIEAEVLLKPAG